MLSVNGTDVTAHSLGAFLAADDDEVCFILHACADEFDAKMIFDYCIQIPPPRQVCALLSDVTLSTQGTAIDFCCLKPDGVRVHHRIYREPRKHVEQTTQLWHLLQFLLESLKEGKPRDTL